MSSALLTLSMISRWTFTPVTWLLGFAYFIQCRLNLASDPSQLPFSYLPTRYVFFFNFLYTFLAIGFLYLFWYFFYSFVVIVYWFARYTCLNCFIYPPIIFFCNRITARWFFTILFYQRLCINFVIHNVVVYTNIRCINVLFISLFLVKFYFRNTNVAELIAIAEWTLFICIRETNDSVDDMVLVTPLKSDLFRVCDTRKILQ